MLRKDDLIADYNRMKNSHDALVAALRELVKANEEWNASVRDIIGQPDRPLFSDWYLDKARAALAAAEEGEK